MPRKEWGVAAPAKSSNLELSVANFGPIARADVDLRPMTVFVGPSNTGKSYLAVLIYALHRFFGGMAFGAGFMFGSQSIFSIGRSPEDGGSISVEEMDALMDWAADMSKMMREPGRPDRVSYELPEPVAKIVRRRLEDMSGFSRLLDGEIARCFGIGDTRDLIRNQVSDGMSVVAGRPVSTSSRDDAGSIEYRYTRRGDNLDLDASVPSSAPLHITEYDEGRFDRLYAFAMPSFHSRLRDGMSEDERIYIADALLSTLTEEYGSLSLSPLVDRSYYLPADRTGIMHAHRTVVSSLISRAPRAGLGAEPPLPALSGVLADFLEILITLSDRGPTVTGGERDLARKLEASLLSGSILNWDSVGGYPEFSYRPEGWKRELPLMHASSMVSELAPVVLYLRHVVRTGQVLIIEEPESHLHPEMQVEFVRQLAAAVRAGVRVIITTHSEWVLDELANLVRLSELPESDRGGIGGADCALGPDQVGVWLFEPKRRPRGSTVKEIPLSTEYGGFRSGYDDVAIDTHNDWARIANRVEALKAR